MSRLSPFVRSSNTQNASAGTLTVSKPSGVQDGDCLVVGIMGNDTPNDVSAAPSGWTDLFGKMDNGAQWFRAYWKVASGEGASWAWTLSSPNSATAHCVAVQDADSSPINASGAQNNTSQANIQAPSVTTTVDGALLIGFFAKNNGSAITPDGSMTEIQDATNNAQTIETAWQSLGAAGSTGTATSTNNATSTGALIAIAGRLMSGLLFRYGGI